MLRAFFEAGADTTLFDGLYIAGNKEICEQYMGKYPVIFLSLKRVEGLSYKDARYRITELAGREAQRFSFLSESDKLSDNEKEQYQAIVALHNGKYSMDENILTSSIYILSHLLHRHYGQKTVILIDEYDVPLDKAFQNGYYREMVSLIRGLFGMALKTNDSLQFAVLTGCLRISKESIFTGFNNFEVLSVLNVPYDESFGFTDNEVEKLLDDYTFSDHYPEVKEWYDGYHIGDDDIFCPWDVISRTDDLLSKKMNPESYWGGTGNIELVSQMFAKDPESYAEDLQNLLDGKSVTVTLSKDINYEILGGSEDSNHFWSFLFSSGYLTIAKNTEYKSIGDDSKEATVSLVVPNNSVKEELKKAIKWCFTVKNPEYAKSLKTLIWALKEDKAILLQRYLNNTLASYVSVYDTQKGTDKESMYHAFLNGRFSSVFASSKYKYASNAEYGDGRPDFTFLLPLGDSLDSPTVGFIIEIKAAQNEDEMESLAQAALKQAKDKKYAEGMIRKLHDEIDEVRVYGIAFYKKECCVKLEQIHVQ